MSKGVLLVNLGLPDSTSVGDVRKYLREFLMDGRGAGHAVSGSFLRGEFCNSAFAPESIGSCL
jgi:hypothetical protein